jgi:hypothetical protein
MRVHEQLFFERLVFQKRSSAETLDEVDNSNFLDSNSTRFLFVLYQDMSCVVVSVDHLELGFLWFVQDQLEQRKLLWESLNILQVFFLCFFIEYFWIIEMQILDNIF